MTRNSFQTIYDRIARSGDHVRNLYNLKAIQLAVLTVSAIGTGFTNAFAHRQKLTTAGAIVLALLILVFVEKFTLTLRHGLNTVYVTGRQRFYAQICYRTIQATLVLNTAIFCVWVGDIPMPDFLLFWSRWSIAVHLALALIGVSAVLDADPVAANRILELKAERAQQAHRDTVLTRKSAAIGNIVVMYAAHLRGLMEAWALARRILTSPSSFATDSMAEIERLAKQDFALLGTGDDTVAGADRSSKEDALDPESWDPKDRRRWN